MALVPEERTTNALLTSKIRTVKTTPHKKGRVIVSNKDKMLTRADYPHIPARPAVMMKGVMATGQAIGDRRPIGYAPPGPQIWVKVITWRIVRTVRSRPPVMDMA